MPHRPLVSGLLACSQMVALAVVMHTPKEAAAWSFNLQSASRRVFMYVGTATYTYNAQGNATGVNNNPIVDTMQVTVQENLGLLGSHYRQLFTSVPRTRYTSQWNRASACPLGYSIIVGAGYQNSANTPASASVTLSSPSSLTSPEGYQIPFANITWDSYSPDTLRDDPRWIGQGTLGTTQTLATVPRNTVSEVCFEFAYGNPTPYPAGTYEGIVTFTASTP